MTDIDIINLLVIVLLIVIFSVKTGKELLPPRCWKRQLMAHETVKTKMSMNRSFVFLCWTRGTENYIPRTMRGHFLGFDTGRYGLIHVPGPAQTAKKKHAPAQTAKKEHAPAPSERVVFAVWGGWVCSFFCCLGGGRVLFLLFGRGACSFFAVWAGACSFFCCLGGGMFFFCCLGLGRVFFLLFGRGTGVHSLTGLPGLVLRD